MGRRLATRSVHMNILGLNSGIRRKPRMVAGLLVVADSRLNPDMIVAHSFVTSGRYRNEPLLRHDCQLAGVGADESGQLFPCVGKHEYIHGFGEKDDPFWVLGHR
jgi:hypothetical protein